MRRHVTWKLFSYLFTVGVVLNILALADGFSIFRLFLLVLNLAVCIGAFVQLGKHKKYESTEAKM